MNRDASEAIEVGPRRWVRPDLLEIPGYEPVEPPEALARKLGLPVSEIVKLDANENPYGPSPRVVQALASYGHYHIYPDPEHRQVRQALSKYLGVGPEYIVAGSGADELLDIMARMVLTPGVGAVNNVPTFGMYPFVIQVAGGQVVAVRRRDDFTIDLAGVHDAVAQGAKLVFVCSPNNPSGNLVPPEELEALLALDALIIVDEAYAEFAGQSYVHLVPKHKNLVVLRTFSKWAGLAGLRAGYGIMPPSLAQLAVKVKMPYNLNVAAEVAMLASLEDAAALRRCVQEIIDERERLLLGLTTVPFLRPYPSRGNFLLCAVHELDARDVWWRLRQQGIIIRYYNNPLLQNYIRISVGRPQDTARLLTALRQIGEHVGGRT